MRGYAKRLVLTFLLFVVSLQGCGTVLFTRDSNTRTLEPATHSETMHFFFWGLVGKHDLYADQICFERDVDQVTTEYSTGNVIGAILTLGVYWPRTAKVWCSL